MDRITFVACTIVDIPLVQELAREIWHEHYPGIISVEQIDYMLDLMCATEVIERELALGTCWMLIRLDGEPVGFVSYSNNEVTGVCKLHKLYVQVKHHGQGLGQAGLAHVMQAAAAAGAREISLLVNKHNSKAVRAYQRAGFAVAESVVTQLGQGYVMNDFRMTIPVKHHVRHDAREP
jgi:ribosomal protein S18 acetylase RimI-like enzyme